MSIQERSERQATRGTLRNYARRHFVEAWKIPNRSGHGLARRIAGYPGLVPELIRYFTNDLMALLRRYSYETRTILVVALPKSGSTWVRSQLARIPGFNIRPTWDSSGVIERWDIAESTFRFCPRWGFNVVKLHTRYSPENLAVIDDQVDRFVLLVRDLRDVAVSRYFHVLNDATHRHHSTYRSIPEEQGIQASLDVIAEEFTPWVADWLAVQRRRPDEILLMTYEELNRDPRSAFQRICEFHGITVSTKLLERFAGSRISPEDKPNNEIRPGAGLGTTSSARHGRTGEWRRYLSEAQAKLAEERMGGVLRDLGYETRDE